MSHTRTLTYTLDLCLKDETPVTVEYTYKEGSPDTWMEPGDPPEAEIVQVYKTTTEEVVDPSDDEVDHLYNQIHENHEPDYGPED